MSETSNALRAMSVSSALPSLFPIIIIDPLAVMARAMLNVRSIA
jgi:hypothetical protein